MSTSVYSRMRVNIWLSMRWWGFELLTSLLEFADENRFEVKFQTQKMGSLELSAALAELERDIFNHSL
jgi:hypothetical protein